MVPAGSGLLGSCAHSPGVGTEPPTQRVSAVKNGNTAFQAVRVRPDGHGDPSEVEGAAAVELLGKCRMRRNTSAGALGQFMFLWQQGQDHQDVPVPPQGVPVPHLGQGWHGGGRKTSGEWKRWQHGHSGELASASCRRVSDGLEEREGDIRRAEKKINKKRN